jgi:integrase
VPSEDLPVAEVAFPGPLRDQLVAAIVAGTKTTTSGLVADYEQVLLALETGLKKAELLDLRVSDFDFSNRYQPDLWLRHTGRQVFKDRRLKLPPQVIPVLEEYVTRYRVTDTLFPYTPRHVEQVLTAAAR